MMQAGSFEEEEEESLSKQVTEIAELGEATASPSSAGGGFSLSTRDSSGFRRFTVSCTASTCTNDADCGQGYIMEMGETAYVVRKSTVAEEDLGDGFAGVDEELGEGLGSFFSALMTSGSFTMMQAGSFEEQTRQELGEALDSTRYLCAVMTQRCKTDK